MDARTLRLLGLDAPAEGGTTYSGQFNGLPEPIANPRAPSFSASGINRNVATPYRQTGGVVLPGQETEANPGTMDEGLRQTLTAGDQGWMDRGANAFLGGGFNPWGMESGPAEGERAAPRSQASDIQNLFDTAQSLGMDTSKYSRELGLADIRGGRSNAMDATQLYDDLNDYAKDYVAVGGLSNGWSGGPDNTVSRTIYKEVDGRLVPVTQPIFHGRQSDNGFFDKEFMGALSTVGLAALGGYLAAPAAAASTAGGAAAGGTAAAGSAAGSAGGAAAGGATSSLASQAANALGLGAEWASLPAWGQRAITGALQGGLSSGIQGGNILQGALTGGATGAAGSMTGEALGGLGLPDWASRGISGALTGGLGSALRGGDVLSGALSGGVSGGLSGAGVPSALANIGGRAISGALAGSGGAGSDGAPIAGSTPTASSGLVSALSGGSPAAVEQSFNPNDARQRYLVNALRLNRSGKAGDQSQDQANALRKALAEITG